MRLETTAARAACALLVVLAAGCASRASAPAAAAAAAGTSPAPAPSAPAVPRAPASSPVTAVLAYADRVRTFAPTELAAEVQRLGDGSASPTQALQLAIALAQGGDPAQVARAQALLQRVLAQPDPEAQALQPLARLVASHLADQRRFEEQAERQGRELREARRRIDSLNERLEAVRAIERSLPTPPRGQASAPRPQP